MSNSPQNAPPISLSFYPSWSSQGPLTQPSPVLDLKQREVDLLTEAWGILVHSSSLLSSIDIFKKSTQMLLQGNSDCGPVADGDELRHWSEVTHGLLTMLLHPFPGSPAVYLGLSPSFSLLILKREGHGRNRCFRKGLKAVLTNTYGGSRKKN